MTGKDKDRTTAELIFHCFGNESFALSNAFIVVSTGKEKIKSTVSPKRCKSHFILQSTKPLIHKFLAIWEDPY